MRHEELFYLLALQNVDGVGDINARKLLSHFGSAEAIFKLKPQQVAAISGFGQRTAAGFKNPKIFKDAAFEMEFVIKNQIESWLYDDPDYPERLRHCPDAPLVLFKSGHVNSNGRKVISIVGTRQLTMQGAEFCRHLIAELAPLNPVIVSGFAFGTDITAHLAALDNGLQTIAVVAHGLNQIYPKIHRKHLNNLMSNGGLLTEFRSSSNPERENFVKRNRIVAGMSEATIVIESAEKGGSLITARLANDYHREVFAVPGRTTDLYSVGCNNLIKTQRAQLLTNAADLVYQLNWDLKAELKPVQKQLFIDLSRQEQQIFDYLQLQGKTSLDFIAMGCETPVSQLSAILLGLELKGVVRPLPGKMFETV